LRGTRITGTAANQCRHVICSCHVICEEF